MFEQSVYSVILLISNNYFVWRFKNKNIIAGYHSQPAVILIGLSPSGFGCVSAQARHSFTQYKTVLRFPIEINFQKPTVIANSLGIDTYF